MRMMEGKAAIKVAMPTHDAEEASHEETSEMTENTYQRLANLAFFAFRTQLLSWHEVPERNDCHDDGG